MAMTELEQSLLEQLHKAKTGEEIRAVVMQLPDGDGEPWMTPEDLLSSATEQPTRSTTSTSTTQTEKTSDGSDKVST
ncbi:hypothetical protein [Thiohalocapsa marina]|uniref:hypothetical protein n=1 Tax=Thiohalocapsa marina TaxID=424902 RepID=UPI0036D7B29B